MRAKDRARARRHLDKRLNILKNPEVFARPPRGWVKAIREALGMTADQLGRRMGVTRQRALELEASEARSAVTLESLERAANSLDCRLVYAFVPRASLDELVQERATKVARKQLRATGHSMALEDQAVDPADEDEQLRRLSQDLVERSGSVIWENEWTMRLARRMFGHVWGWAGAYRRSDKNIGVDWHRIPIDLRQLLEDGRLATDLLLEPIGYIPPAEAEASYWWLLAENAKRAA